MSEAKAYDVNNPRPVVLCRPTFKSCRARAQACRTAAEHAEQQQYMSKSVLITLLLQHATATCWSSTTSLVLMVAV